MNDKADDSKKVGDYPIGYGRPPVGTRFPSGKSGNPQGRPRGSKNLNTLFAEELSQSVTLNENGRRRRIPKRRAIITQVINKAVTCDLKATGLVLDQLSRMEGESAGAVGFAFDSREDALVIESVIRRIRLADDGPIPVANAPQDSKEKP